MAELHPSIIALVSLASGIASKHPDMGLCQLDRLRVMGISEEQLAVVVEVARHIRDEASQKLDWAFNEKAQVKLEQAVEVMKTPVETDSESCCSMTPNGQACC